MWLIWETGFVLQKKKNLRYSVLQRKEFIGEQKWACAWQNQQNDLCTQWRLRSSCAVSESSLSIWNLESLVTHWELSEDWSDWEDAHLLGTQAILLVLSWLDFISDKKYKQIWKNFFGYVMQCLVYTVFGPVVCEPYFFLCQMKWCSQVFIDPLPIVCQLITDTLGGLDPPLSDCLKTFTTQKQDTLTALIEIKQVVYKL